MRNLTLCCLFWLATAFTARGRLSQDPTFNRLVDELKSLSPDASWSEFLNRPAMSKLMALGPSGYPALREVFLKDRHWAVQASVGYLVVTMAGIDSEVSERLKSLMKDESLFVRATAITLYGSMAPGIFEEVLSNPNVRAIADRLPLAPSIDWMAPADVLKLAANSLLVIDKGRPFLDPPAWDSAVGRTYEGDVSRIQSAGLRAVTFEHAMAERVFLRFSDSMGIRSPDVHKALDLLLVSLESDGGSDLERLARKVRLTDIVLGHQHPDCSDGKCKDLPVYKDRLFDACDRWVWNATDPNLLHAIESALRSIIKLDKAKALLERLKDQHSNPEFREMTALHLGHYEDWLSSEEKERERQRLHREQIEREEKERDSVRPESPVHSPVRVPKPVKIVTTPETGQSGSWILGGVALAALISAVIYYKTRR